jgi:hypothetical protein
VTTGFDPSATLVVHRGNDFDADFSPLSNCSFEPLQCRLLSLGADMQRREFITFLGGTAVAWPLAAHAQQPALPVIGFLNTASPGPLRQQIAAFHEGLKQSAMSRA